ncbi:MAG: FkbM family methyltransferase [Thermoanaerobaculia bacterium]|nr:FkbM family methyltransferase [Thermoanaerobaculia bacterium]
MSLRLQFRPVKKGAQGGLRHLGKEMILRRAPGLFWSYVRLRHGFLEPEMVLLPDLCRRDRTSVDVGANDGIYSYYLLKYSSGCIAFEPHPHLAQTLRQGLGHRVRVIEAALSDRQGTSILREVTFRPGLSTIEPENPISRIDEHPHSVREVAVRVLRLDDLATGPLGFMKIDVEGHEAAVLSGSMATLRRDLPTLLLELEDQRRPRCREEVQALLAPLGYSGFFLHRERLRPLSAFDPRLFQNQDRPDLYIRNFIFLPENRMSPFASRIQRV